MPPLKQDDLATADAAPEAAVLQPPITWQIICLAEMGDRMDVTGFLAWKVDPEARRTFAGDILWHYTRLQYWDKIDGGPLPSGSPFGNRLVNLRPPSSLNLNPWKFIRDFTVIAVFPDADFDRYIYFFRGEPSERVRAQNVQRVQIAIQVRGEDLIAQAGDRLYFRRWDKVVAVRSGYSGPAWVERMAISTGAG
jgi:hypothetical protein